MKYKAELINKSGCVFDVADFGSKAGALAWAKRRGRNYKLVLSETDKMSLDDYKPFVKKFK